MMSATNLKNEFYRYACECSSFAIIGTDCQGIIISCNNAAETLFRKTSQKILGANFVQLLPKNRREALYHAIERAIEDNQPSEIEIVYNERAEIEKKGGQYLSLTLTPVVNDDKQILGLSIWVQDITSRKTLQDQLNQAEKMASLGTLASGVAHHFNNIIGGVATFADFALASDNPQSSRRALKMTAEASSRISQITSSLLTFAEKDMRKFDLSDLTEVVMTFGHLVEHTLNEKKIKLELHLQAVPVYEVPGTRVHQILGNLLSNAENAMPNGGQVTLGLRREGDSLVLTFSDNGMGISPAILPRVFEPFFTTRGVLAGGDQCCDGLGLSVVHGIVKELGGTIGVASKINEGTTFTIRLPWKTHEGTRVKSVVAP
ncbi:MAG: PAS domain S-box protein [Phycisphaerae bacterium]|nr:PAS domain S-box protein [Phycisphaerae bacterium]